MPVAGPAGTTFGQESRLLGVSIPGPDLSRSAKDAWDTAVQLDDVLRASIGTKPRQGFCEIAATLLTEYGVRFMPALAPLPLRADEPEGFFTPPEQSAVAALGPAEWRVLGSLLKRQPAHEAVLELSPTLALTLTLTTQPSP